MHIGIDLGGTKTEIIVLDEENKECFRKRVNTPAKDYAAILQCIAQLCRDAISQFGDSSIGIGIPGAISPATGLVKNANTTVLIGKPLAQDLTQALGQPVNVANDADCFCLSEAVDGAGKGADAVFGVILGTGVGGGICIHQRIISGPNAITGEWGHNPLPWPSTSELPGADCYCGKQGCIETWLSGPGFAAHYQHALQASPHSGTLMTRPADIFNAYQTSEAAKSAVDGYIDRLARSLATVINILDPNVIVLGGGLSNIERLYTDLPMALPKYVFSDCVNTPILQAQHGDASGVRGAAWLGAQYSASSK